MRDNGPVTQKEHLLDPNLIIVSKTDTLGNITEANEAFIEASGFDWTELVGQPHNLLRHPDIPEAVFADLWKTIQSGKPWSQIVKNRRKNGDHYWVEATTTPVFEDGQLTGYMSVRRAASNDQKIAAEAAYKAIAAGKLKLVGGNVATLKDKLNPVLNFNLSKIIIVLLVLLFLSEFPILLFPEYIPHEVTEGIHFMLIFAIIWLTFRHEKQLVKLDEHITNLTEGKFDNQIDYRGKTLMSHVSGRLKSLQTKLGAEIEEVKAALNSSQRIESALNATSANIMVVDRFDSVIFANGAIQQTFADLSNELNQSLPELDSNNLLRQKLSVFFVESKQMCQTITNIRETHNERLKVGKLTLDVTIDPIFNHLNERIGTVIEWKDVTEHLAIEQNIEHIVSQASRGMLSSHIDHTHLDGFEKKLAISVNDLLSSFSKTMDSLDDILSGMSEGDLTQRLTANYIGDLMAMKYAVNNALTNIEITLGQVKIGAESIGDMSTKVSDASHDLSNRTQQQAASLEETAASMNELTDAVQRSSVQTEKANELAHSAATEAEEGIQVMTQTLNAMSDIQELSKKINEITNVIDSIAFQTNLLALNAAVEAARAGEHGRGFAVVAGEVRSLAQKSADAAKDISTLIGSATQQIQTGTHLVEKTNIAFEGMVQKIKEVEGLVSDVAANTSEQTRGIEQINGAISGLDQMTQENAILVEQLSETAAQMKNEAGQQADFIGRFKINPELQDRSKHAHLNIEFSDAKMKHNSWITKLEQLLAGQHTSLQAQDATKPESCPLGQWIYGEGQKYAHLPSMTKLIQAHVEFHVVAGKVITACKLGDLEKARDFHRNTMDLSDNVVEMIDQVEMDVNNSHATQGAEYQPPALPDQAA